MANEFNIQNGFISNGNSTVLGNLNVTGGTQSIFSGNSSVELVRITQTGAGDAFVVEDSVNVDSSHFVITASGDTAIGLTQPLGGAKLTVSGNTNVFGDLSGTTLYGDGSNITNIANKLIAMTELTASTLVTHTMGTTNFTAFNLNSDATNRLAKITFTAPSSGKVSIEMLFDMLISNSAAVQMIGLNTTTGATSTPSEGWYRINADNDATSGQFYAQFVKTNLTPGNSYTYYFMGVCNFSGNQVRISSIQTGAYSAGSDLPAPLRIMVYDLDNVVITTNPSS
jgi:hypothetical protein